MKPKTWTVAVVIALVLAMTGLSLYVVSLNKSAVNNGSGQSESTIWPLPSSHETFTDMTTAVYSVATDFAHMKDVVVDNSGKVSANTWAVLLQSGSAGPRTTVYLTKRSSDNSWWVTSAVAQDIVLGTPKWNSTVKSPFHVTGLSTAFEAVVNGQVLSRQNGKSLTKFTAMGGSNGIVGAFSTVVSIPQVRRTTNATLLLYEVSAKDGSVTEFSASPIVANPK